MRVLRGIKPESKSISSADNTEPSCGRVAPHCQRTSLGYRLGRYRSSRHRISPGTAPAQRSPRVPAPYTRREKPPTSATDAPPVSPCPHVPLSSRPRVQPAEATRGIRGAAIRSPRVTGMALRVLVTEGPTSCSAGLCSTGGLLSYLTLYTSRGKHRHGRACGAPLELLHRPFLTSVM